MVNGSGADVVKEAAKSSSCGGSYLQLVLMLTEHIDSKPTEEKLLRSLRSVSMGNLLGMTVANSVSNNL